MENNKSFISQNIAYILAIFVSIIWGVITSYIIFAAFSAILSGKPVGDLTAVATIWGSVTGIQSTILSYYFGSSQGSVDKQKHIERLTEKSIPTSSPTP